ncbi:MAG: hypothetical protein XD69_0579 [Clostridia bacterium 62_21]|nr:MAG: hypothetical protein XD69_0579 [Clostridia bacterium 62_21]HAG06843.1 hypothetical protein [Peptococcaceae bacterium]
MGFWNTLDNLLIIFFKITGEPVLDYFLGMFLLALLTVAIGEFTISLAFLINRKHLESQNARMVKMYNLSLAALKSGKQEEYKACNKEANDAFGRVFFNAIAFSAAYLWPVPFVLAWMQMRFAGIEIPLPFTRLTANYFVIFLLCYVLARLLFGALRPRLPYFGKIHRMLEAYAQKQAKIEGFADLLPKKN